MIVYHATLDPESIISENMIRAGSHVSEELPTVCVSFKDDFSMVPLSVIGPYSPELRKFSILELEVCDKIIWHKEEEAEWYGDWHFTYAEFIEPIRCEIVIEVLSV